MGKGEIRFQTKEVKFPVGRGSNLSWFSMPLINFQFLLYSDKDILIAMDIAAVTIILIAIFLTLCGLAKSHRSKCIEITASLLFILASKFDQHNRLILLRFKNAEATVLTFDRQTSAILNLQPLFPTGDSLFPFVS